MDLWTVLRVVGRHLPVLVIGLVVTAVAVVVVDHRLAEQYSASGTVIVTQPGGEHGNPLTQLSSSSALAAAVTVELARSRTGTAELRALGGTADHTLTADPNLPIIRMTATSTDPDTAVRTVGALAQVMNDGLRLRQKELALAAATWLTVVPVDAPTDATATTAKKKVLGIAAVLGALAVISLTFVAEAVAVLRHRRRAPAANVALDLSEPGVAGDLAGAVGALAVASPTFVAELARALRQQRRAIADGNAAVDLSEPEAPATAPNAAGTTDSALIPPRPTLLRRVRRWPAAGLDTALSEVKNALTSEA